MPELTLPNLSLPHRTPGVRESKRGLNFITTKVDPVEVSLSWSANLVLLASVVVAFIVWITCGYKYYLREKLNRLGEQVETLGAQVQEKMNTPVGDGVRFESKFLATQQKLARYEQLVDDEKMVDFFQIVGALMPEGIKMVSLTIEPHSVQIVCFVSSEEALRAFASNINYISNHGTFPDGTKLIIDEVNVPDITMASNQGSGDQGWELTMSFDYTIQSAPVVEEG